MGARNMRNIGPKLMAGARRVLARLRNASSPWAWLPVAIAIVSRANCANFRLNNTISQRRVCSGDTLRKKPHPEPLRLALRQMQLHPSACVYVGDAPQDVEMARTRPACAPLGVLGPFPPRRSVCAAARPEFLIGSIEELPDVSEKIALFNGPVLLSALALWFSPESQQPAELPLAARSERA